MIWLLAAIIRATTEIVNVLVVPFRRLPKLYVTLSVCSGMIPPLARAPNNKRQVPNNKRQITKHQYCY